MNKAIFIDKDGTLIKDVPYNIDPEFVQFETGAFHALKQFQDAGYLVVIISNQSGIARGLFSEQQFKELIIFFHQQFNMNALHLAGFYYCPHHPESVSEQYRLECDCRKPAPGLIFRASSDLHIDLSRSWMIGDILHDVEAGNRAGCKTVLIDNGNETEWLKGEFRTPDLTVHNLVSAAELILNNADQ